MAMIAWPVVIGGLAVFATAPFVQVVALPLLLLSWIGCMRLALTISTNLPSRRTQLGASLLVALGLLLNVCICVRVAALAGLSHVADRTSPGVDLALYHVAALGAAGLVVWGQRLRSAPAKPAWVGWLIYCFAYCPVSALVAKGLTRVGIALGA